MLDSEKIIQPVFGNWYIEDKIGSGAFGTVYKIKREEFGTVYYAALKVISIPQTVNDISSLQSEGMDSKSISDYYTDLAQNFVKEIELLAALKGNTNIVSYEDHSIIPNKYGVGYTILIRMELLKPLNTYISECGFTQKDVVRLGIDMCKALELCETKNIIHRDIKPDNIFISDTGAFKLGDFGVARQMEKTMSSLSQKGTYTYMAPEVFKGNKYDSTVDIYSLGIVLYRLLNHNRTPFLPPAPQAVKYSDREQAQIMRMRGDDIPPISEISPALNQIILIACNYNPAKRYRTATAFRRSLEGVLSELNDNKPVMTYAESLKLISSEVSHHDYIKFSDGSVKHFERSNNFDTGGGLSGRLNIEIFDENEIEDFGETQSDFSERKITSVSSGKIKIVDNIETRPQDALKNEPTLGVFSGNAPKNNNYPISIATNDTSKPLKSKGVKQIVGGILLMLLSLVCLWFISIWAGTIMFVNSIVLIVFGSKNLKAAKQMKEVGYE